MLTFEIQTLIDLLERIEKNQKEKNPKIEYVTVKFDDKKIYAKSYIKDKIVRENTIELKVTD